VKVSGDLRSNPEILQEIKKLAGSHPLSLVYGFGTELSELLKEKNIPYAYVNGIREMGPEGLELALQVSEKARQELKNVFREYHNITIISPVEKVGGKIVNTNSDVIVQQRKDEYSKIIVYTKKGRDKSSLQREIPHLEIRYAE
jgi:acetylglutamate kinase